MALGYCQCLLKCLCITVPPTYFPHHVFRHHVFPPPRIPSPRISSTTYPDLYPATTTTTATDVVVRSSLPSRGALRLPTWVAKRDSTTGESSLRPEAWAA